MFRVVEHRRSRPGRTHSCNEAPNTIRCDDVRWCDGGMEANDAVTFDLMESHRAECFAPFGCCFVETVKLTPAPEKLLLTVGKLHPSDEHNCY